MLLPKLPICVHHLGDQRDPGTVEERSGWFRQIGRYS